MYLKNVGLTSKSQILKFMIQQKGFDKKAAEGYVEMFKNMPFSELSQRIQ